MDMFHHLRFHTPVDIFPLERFNATFPIFSDLKNENNEYRFEPETILRAGNAAMKHIRPSVCGMPMENVQVREYALFLMTAHILLLHKSAVDDLNDGTTPVGGLPYKSSVGSVSVENCKPNSFSIDDYSYWLDQTSYGQELLALLDAQAPLGVFINNKRDSVRVLW